MAFFKEIPKTTGDLRFEGRLAYVEQEIVIYPGTVRSNILFGREYDEAEYQKIVSACCLLDDFKEFPGGDLMETGERGINLSGGQKARISLARALYSDADIYLLDDPLSAVDTRVAKNLFQNGIRGYLKNKTVILVTHQVHFAREAEKIVVLDEGCIKAEGTLEEIINKDQSILSIFETSQGRKKSGNDEEILTLSQEHKTQRNEPALEESSRELNDESDEEDLQLTSPLNLQNEEKGKLISEEDDESTNVGWSVYSFYMKSIGSFSLIILLIACSAGIEGLYIVYTRMLGHWAKGTWETNQALSKCSARNSYFEQSRKSLQHV